LLLALGAAQLPLLVALPLVGGAALVALFAATTAAERHFVVQQIGRLRQLVRPSPAE
ncbi:MAG: hypothetical protein HC876_10780, partial [Chloroflexaceae bacterium]|nr:hypothetical protein [Chloroflexaceae bacterium]